MNAVTNRVLLAFKSWDDRKKEMEPLLKPGIADEQVLCRLQLTHLRQAAHRLQETARLDEKPFMVLLTNRIQQLERQIYPNVIARLFASLKDRLYDGPSYLRQLATQRAANMENLKQQLKESGFGSVAGRLEDHLDREQNSVYMPLACQLDPENRLTFTLYFDKDNQGNFQLDRFYAAIKYKGAIGTAHDFRLKDWPGIKANQAWSLLEGRPLKQTFTDASGQQSQRWVEFTKYGIQHYDPGYAYDIKSVVAGIPQITGSKPELISYLENGQRAPAHWKVGQQYQSISIQADPANRTLKFFDAKDRPITPEKLNQNALQQVASVKTLGAPVQKMRKGVKNGHQH